MRLSGCPVVMNPVERAARRVDAAQQRHTATAFAVGVAKKFSDDNGGVLVGSLAHSAFVSLFPLLLVLVTILGLLASSNSGLRQEAINAVAHQFPLVGKKLASNVYALRHSSLIGLIVGLLATIWGSTGLAQAGMFTMESVWNLPGPARPGYWQRLGRAMVFLGVLGLIVVTTTLLTSLDTYGHHAPLIVILAEILAVLANSGMYLIAFRVLTPKGVPTRNLLPGVAAGGVAWTLMQALGTYLVHHYLRIDSVYGIFATVLGLVAWLYIGVEITVYAAEINVVLTRHLWPRSIVQPPITDADRGVMAAQALQNQRRPEQHIEVTFSDRPPGAKPSPLIPHTPEEIVPPGPPPPE
jgi:YihY family inner membrane protein